MELKITPAIYGRKVQSYNASNKILDQLGVDGFNAMISDFYDKLIQSPIKHLFPIEGSPLQRAKDHSADFFIQRFGGENNYQKKRGKPMMNRRHAPFEITPEARDEWLKCFREVLLAQSIDEDVKKDFWLYLDTFSTHMINTPSSKPRFVFNG